jgi:hypothetical protein
MFQMLFSWMKNYRLWESGGKLNNVQEARSPATHHLIQRRGAIWMRTLYILGMVMRLSVYLGTMSLVYYPKVNIPNVGSHYKSRASQAPAAIEANGRTEIRRSIIYQKLLLFGDLVRLTAFCKVV